MLLKLDNPKIFSEIISIISDMVLEVRMKVNKEEVLGMMVAMGLILIRMIILPVKLPLLRLDQLKYAEQLM